MSAVFRTRLGANDIEVRQPEAVTAEQVHASTSELAWSRAWGRANDYWECMQEEANRKIQQSETTEVTPWLKRTRWLTYSDGCDRMNC